MYIEESFNDEECIKDIINAKCNSFLHHYGLSVVAIFLHQHVCRLQSS